MHVTILMFHGSILVYVFNVFLLVIDVCSWGRQSDEASLLAEVTQHEKELKHQTSLIAGMSLNPTEIDEVTVHTLDEDGKIMIKASLRYDYEDRSDLLPDLIKTLKRSPTDPISFQIFVFIFNSNFLFQLFK